MAALQVVACVSFEVRAGRFLFFSHHSLYTQKTYVNNIVDLHSASINHPSSPAQYLTFEPQFTSIILIYVCRLLCAEHTQYPKINMEQRH